MLAKIDVRLSIMACKWAPSCKKFALAACPSSLIVGYYNVEVACWTALAKEKIVSVPITSIDFHPSCNIIALGSIDGSVKIVSCSFKSQTDKLIIDSKVEDFPYSGPFEKVTSFGEVLYSIDNILPNMKIWINHVSFENNGKNFLVLTHSNHNKFYDVKEGDNILVN
jgi:WD40 repeat protein